MGWPSFVVVFAGVSLALVASALAQPASGPPNALQGFSQNRDQPVKIDAATLEVRDKDKVATFLGNVRVVQGDTTMHCETLVVYYDQGETPRAMKTAQPAPAGQGKIRRLEAKGGVIVTQKDQTATGDTGELDMATNTVTLNGSVVISQGQNVVKGDRLVVDLTSGVSRVECGKSTTCRVQALIQPNSGRDSKEAAGKAGAPKDTQRPRPAAPSGLY